jgi:7,8-dihydropterin-6-yl-methyl-4-(beta-D-ribofuranosyl)aminobenzene 5'-phosphate synthase
MASNDLVELDSVEIFVIVDNELDPISPSPNPGVEQTGGMRTIGFNGPDISKDSSRGGAVRELRMDHICCSAHGLSLMIIGVRDGQRRTVLFDTGPEEHAWERNAKRLGADVGKIEVVQLSHWHRDHSGGMLKAVSMIQAAKGPGAEPVHVDLHPARPDYRGMQPPEAPIVSSEDIQISLGTTSLIYCYRSH